MYELWLQALMWIISWSIWQSVGIVSIRIGMICGRAHLTWQGTFNALPSFDMHLEYNTSYQTVIADCLFLLIGIVCLYWLGCLFFRTLWCWLEGLTAGTPIHISAGLQFPVLASLVKSVCFLVYLRGSFGIVFLVFLSTSTSTCLSTYTPTRSWPAASGNSRTIAFSVAGRSITAARGIASSGQSSCIL